MASCREMAARQSVSKPWKSVAADPDERLLGDDEADATPGVEYPDVDADEMPPASPCDWLLLRLLFWRCATARGAREHAVEERGLAERAEHEIDAPMRLLRQLPRSGHRVHRLGALGQLPLEE